MKLKIIIGFFTFFLISIHPVYAEEINLSLSPSTIEIVAEPGESLRVPLTLVNNGKATESLSIFFKPFTKLTENGSIDLTAKEETTVPFISLLKDDEVLSDYIDLRPDETATIILLVQIPKETTEEDSYITLLFQTKSQASLAESQTASHIEGGVGTNIILSIKREQKITPQTRITGFQTQQFVFSDNPLLFSLEVANEGKHFVRASGRIDVADVLGNPIHTIALPEKIILASSGRDLAYGENGFSSDNLFGKYTATATITVDETALIKTFSFYVIPKNIILSIAGGLLLLAVIVSRIRLHLLRSKRLSRQKRKKQG